MAYSLKTQKFSQSQAHFFLMVRHNNFENKIPIPINCWKIKSEKKTTEIGKIPPGLLMPQLRMNQNKLSLPKIRKLSKVRNRKKKLCLVICASPYVTNHNGVKKNLEEYSYSHVPSL